MYLQKEEIKIVHIELTSRCNLLCPMCARTQHTYVEKNFKSRRQEGSLNPRLKIKDLSRDTIKKIFIKDFCPQLYRVYINGNYGDPVATELTLPFLKYCRKQGVERLQLYTNGSAGSVEWWRQLAKILKRKEDLVVFSLDGLADTNHLYRVNSNWQIIWRNVNAYISAGGNVRWDFIVFDHNKHQIEDARELARKAGFKSFNLKYTNRWLDIDKNVLIDDYKIKHRDKEWQIKPAKNYTAEQINIYKKNHSRKAKINCITKKEKNIYIDFNGDVWPCCWLGTISYAGPGGEKDRDYQTLISRYGKNFNSLKHHSWEEILEHQWFKHDLEKSWRFNFDKDRKRLYTCDKQCGSVLGLGDKKKNQFPEIINL